MPDRLLEKGEVLRCRDMRCGLKVEVLDPGACRGLTCCGKPMESQNRLDAMDLYERETLGQCDEDDA
jgi:desulfoferrodoxin-like iron-binding protein